MSFNVRNSRADDGADSWPHRKELLLKTITDYDPDLLGTQEVRDDQYDFLTAHLKGYGAVGVARDDGKRKGEWALVQYRESRFTALDSGSFWLSETPEVPGSVSWDAALTRICSWVRLKDKSTGKELLFANTHFDHRGKLAQERAGELIARRLPELAQGAPILLTGDFNVGESHPAYPALTKDGTLIDSWRTVHPKRDPKTEGTFHAFKGGTAHERIDYIFHSPHFRATAADIVHQKSDAGRYPSDHYPITATLRYTR